MKIRRLPFIIFNKTGFKLIAVLSYILLFVFERIRVLRLTELELLDATDVFSVSDICFGGLDKFYDYFAVPLPDFTLYLQIAAIAMLVLGLAALILSLFSYRRVQIVNVFVSFLSFLVSLAFGILLYVYAGEQNSVSERNRIMEYSVYFTAFLPALFSLTGFIFTYAFVKMPKYVFAEGRFFKAMGCAFSPFNFTATFKKTDPTEDKFRATTPLKRRKYQSFDEPKSIRNSETKKAKKSAASNTSKAKSEKKAGGESKADDGDKRRSSAQNAKPSALELALAKRAHAEEIANSRVEASNRALFKKEPRKPKGGGSKIQKTSASAGSSRAKERKQTALELAKARAAHAEKIARSKTEES